MADPIHLPPDYHTHTQLCNHAEGMPADYLATATARGLPAMAASDHVPCPFGYDPEHRMTEEEMEQYNEAIDAARAQSDTPILKGIEADFYHGCYIWLEHFLAEQDFDLVLGSVHYQCFWADKIQNRTLWDDPDITNVWKRYFKLIGLMAGTGLYDVVAHIDLPKKHGSIPDLSLLSGIVEPALDQIALADMAIEINTSGLIHDVNEMYPSRQILSWAEERGIPIVFGSDAHTPDRVGANFEDAVILAKEVGYTEYAVFEKRQMSAQPL